MSVRKKLGQPCQGTIKSFSPKSGWGFIQGDSFSEDVFVSFKLCPNLQGSARSDLVGQAVTFVPVENGTKKGSFEAQTCELNDAPEVGQSALVGKWIDGTVKSWSPDAGWGFLTNSGVPGDIFISKKLCPLLWSFNPQQGMVVRVKVAESKSKPGMFEAAELEMKKQGMGGGNDMVMGGKAMGMGGMMSIEDMQALALGRAVMAAGGKGGLMGGSPWGAAVKANGLGGSMGSKMAGKGGYGPAKGGRMNASSTPYGNPAPIASQTGKKSVGQTVNGYIKSFVKNKGWGFVNSDSFADDCFFNIKNNPHLSGSEEILKAGQQVSFTVQKSASRAGALEAIDISTY